MIHIKQELIRSLSFDDEPIIKMELNSPEKTLKVFIEGASILDTTNALFKDRMDMWLGKGALTFKNWNQLTVYCKKHQNEEPLTLNACEFEQLQDILIFEEGENFVKISGQGAQSGHWNEWMIVGSQYDGEFEEYDITA